MAVGESGVDFFKTPVYRYLGPGIPVSPPVFPPPPVVKPPAPDVTSGPQATTTFPVRTVRTDGSTKTETSYRTTKTQETVVHTVTDNGSGSLGSWGTVTYATGILSVKLVTLNSTTDGYKSDYEDSAAFETSGGGTSSGNDAVKGGEYLDNAMSEEILAASTVSVEYATGTATEIVNTASYKPPEVTIDLCPYTSDYVVPGSVRFTWMGHTYEDYAGVLIRDRSVDEVGFRAGQMNYTTGVATVTDYVVSGSVSSFNLDSLWTIRQNWNTASIFMRTQAAPLKPSGFVMNLTDAQGNDITASAGIDGVISGTHLRGRIEYETGSVELQFGDYVLDSSLTDEQKSEWWYDADDVGAVEALKIWRPWPVDPTTLRYNSVAYFYLPLDASILGLDPVRLPQDGRVPIFRPGGFAVVGHTATTAPATVGNGQTIDLARERISRLRVIGADGVTISTGYTTDLEAGTVTFTDVSGYSQPVSIEHRIEDMAQVSDVQITGALGFTRQLTHDFPAPGSYVSGALVAGDLRSRNSLLFDQASWDGTTWLDSVSGAAATGTYNTTVAPVQVTNEGAVTERWALRFTSTTGGQIIGEHVGVIDVFNINTTTAPINPATGTPYFTLLETGWGIGWSVGNILRLNTVGAQFPVWVVRTIQQGPEAGIDYSFSLLTRGDVDRP